MDLKLKDTFIERWNKYFPGAELPVIFYYTDKLIEAGSFNAPTKAHCMMNELVQVTKGKSVYFDKDSTMCSGGKKYLGFSDKLRANFEYFLSYGIPGEVEGERYKKDPDTVEKSMGNLKTLKAPHKYIVFKRWDKLEEYDEPMVVIFFAKPDVLSGLFTLANFDEVMPDGVIAPFGSGCSSIVNYPYFELQSQYPRAVLGMFDVSARPYLPPGALSFAVPITKFTRMVNNMDESFLITGSWNKLRSRMAMEI
ncbi:MAG: hypothetical protein EHM58_12525 [Ignavibacteriae bacterium]|nr:MAG: hypothetical protein EHM58_12525 [Ignavibacteriota bacterium]